MTDQALDDRLAELLDVERFEVPPEFAADALVTDLSIHEAAAGDPAGWWSQQARELLHWDTPFSTGLDDSNPPFYKWFEDGTLNASYNCLDRHVEAGLGDR